MITDLNKIKELGQINEVSNFSFRSILKSIDSDQLDKTVHNLFRYYSEKIDCKECGNCCTLLKPIIRNNDILNLSRASNKSETEFKSSYIEIDEDGDMRFKELPCPFLSDKKCIYYENRPEDCRSFPYLQRKNFQSRLFAVIDCYSICPIVFNVYEELKQIFHFR